MTEKNAVDLQTLSKIGCLGVSPETSLLRCPSARVSSVWFYSSADSPSLKRKWSAWQWGLGTPSSLATGEGRALPSSSAEAAGVAREPCQG